ncbi:MAG: hypothetical protein M3542_08480 [Acidobacteriota bacterium]|nr:hypothetical protein [Acidobacteriota bacterium]MDQ5871421.1 hypothetical protein [Acidobacteriota bacterium]
MLSPVFLLALLSLAVPDDEPLPQLAPNGSFDRNVAGWKEPEDESNAESGAMAWSRPDARQSKTSGSLELATSATADRDSFRVAQCIRVAAGVENLVFGGRIRVPSGQKARGVANIELERFETADCSGEAAPFEGLGGIANVDFWSKRREIVAAADARSVRLIASVTKLYEWREGDEIGEADDGILFRAQFDDLFATALGKEPAARAPQVPVGADFEPPAGAAKKARWGPYAVDPPALTLAVLDPAGKPHPTGVVAECSSLDVLQLEVKLKTPYGEEDPRAYPLQPVALAGESGVSAPTVDIGLFQTGDRERKLVPIVCDSGDPVAVRVLGDRNQRVGGIRAFYDCLRTALPEASRIAVPPKPTEEELLAWRLAGWVVANPAGEYEIVARYRALEAGFWHEPVLSNPVRIKIVPKEPCELPSIKEGKEKAVGR